MAQAKTAFCKNLAVVVSHLGIDHKVLYTTRIRGARVSKKAVENILHGRVEPRPSTKAVLVEIIRELRISMAGHLSVPDLENPRFNLKQYLSTSVPPIGGEFDVDVLVKTIHTVAEKSRSREEVVNGLCAIPIEAAKMQFWKKISGVLHNIGIKDRVFNETLERVRMPPGLPLQQQKTFLQYATQVHDEAANLSRDQTVIWELATSVYPPFVRQADPDLKRAARYLSWYWNESIWHNDKVWGVSIVADLARQKPAERSLVFLLSWLEIPLVTQTGNVLGQGKSGLFEIGRWFENHSGTP